jgi:ribosomal protein S18 acetylase RimI-like enzyme
MTVELYVGRDPQGRPWAPDFTHEADAAIRIAGRAWRSFYASRELHHLAFNLHNPNIDLLVVTERGIGLVEMKAHRGEIAVGEDDAWYADGQKMVGYKVVPGRERPASSYLNPHHQVQGHGDRLMEKLLPVIRADYPGLTRGKRRHIRMQTCVCFTHPDADLSEIRKVLPRWNRGRLKPWESDFSVATPEEIPDWISALRFEVKQSDVPPYYPFRLDPEKAHDLLPSLFEVERWEGVERMLPVHRYGRLEQVRGERTVASFYLWEEETFLGRDHSKCTIVVPQQYTKVSRSHAVIRRELQGIVLEDSVSHNGTFLNGERIKGKAPLENGARISLGGNGSSEKECSYIFWTIDERQEDLDSTEEPTSPKLQRETFPSSADTR